MIKAAGKNGGNFVPAQSQQVALQGAGGFQLGQQTSIKQQNVLAERPVNIMKPQQMSQKGSPRGAQEIPVVGMTPQAPMGRVASRPVPPQALQLAGQAHEAALPMLGSSGSGSEEVHPVDIVGEGPDGREYVASFDVVFPKGSKILGARERK